MSTSEAASTPATSSGPPSNASPRSPTAARSRSTGSTPDQSVTVTGDQRQLVSAVGNLVENAVKYSEIGGLVQIRSRVVGPWVEFMITDQGPGIPSRDLDRIFERFYRVDKARGRDTGGTGLGLSIVRHVATNHGGDVQVSSREGEGSTFVLRIPTTAAGEHPSGGAPTTKVDPTKADRGVS